jgi:hypothetical protein
MTMKKIRHCLPATASRLERDSTPLQLFLNRALTGGDVEITLRIFVAVVLQQIKELYAEDGED